MSHMSKLATTFQDLECIAQAATELGMELECGDALSVRDFSGKSVAVEARIQFGRYGLGFRKASDGTLEMVGDFWGIEQACKHEKFRKLLLSGLSPEQAMVKLFAQPYTVARVKKEVRENSRYRGFRVVETKNETGEVRITLSRRR